MRNLLKNILAVSLIMLILLTAFSCACNCGRTNEVSIPDSVIKKADNFVIEKTSKDFFEKYITIDFSKSMKNSLGYNIAYKLKMPEKPFVDVLIQFYTDSLGNVNKERGISGLPVNPGETLETAFNIDDEQAVKIAQKAGLEPGIKEWKKMLIWSDKYQAYTWIILSTIEEQNTEGSYKGHGREIVINSSTGKVIDNTEWHIK